MKTLVSTDHYFMGQVLAEYLSRQQLCTHHLVCRSSATVEEVKREKPDLVVLDLEALPCDGLNMIASLRTAEKTAKTIILLTGKECTAYVLRLLASRVSGILSRNSSMDDLASCFSAAADGKAFLSPDVKQLITENDSMIRDAVARINALSKRELQIARLIATGMTSKEVAACVHLSPGTVDLHRHNIFRKLKLKKTIALINLLAGVNSRLLRDPATNSWLMPT